jgi:hypothetical protein
MGQHHVKKTRSIKKPKILRDLSMRARVVLLLLALATANAVIWTVGVLHG